MSEQARAVRVLAMNTLAFMVCFAAWVMNGVLVTFLVEHRVYPWDQAQMGFLIGAPVLTGSLMRLPIGILTDKFGGCAVFTSLMVVSAIPLYLVSAADSYVQFLPASLGFGLCGASFAVGVAYTSIWFRKDQQGTVLGVFGMGNAGAALTSMGAPVVLREITHDAAYLEGWRTLPKVYAALLIVTAVLFFFGSFVALSQWLIPYYVNVYVLSIGTAGLLTALFSLPAGVTRTFGGWLSDKWGAPSVMYGTLGCSLILLILLFPPRMEIQSPGQGIVADRPGTVVLVSPGRIVVGEEQYRLAQPIEQHDVRIRLGIHGDDIAQGVIFFPTASFWQEPAVQVGETVSKGQLLARGITRVYFQANVWVFTSLALLVGIMMGMGSAAVFKHVATYFPSGVGVVGGLVGVIGGLGGFFNPILFGYVLQATGIWTTCWMFLALVSLVCLVWMHLVVRRMMHCQAPDLVRHIEVAPS